MLHLHTPLLVNEEQIAAKTQQAEDLHNTLSDLKVAAGHSANVINCLLLSKYDLVKIIVVQRQAEGCNLLP